jgi:acyl carrier protein
MSNYRASPLKWSVDWNNLKPMDKFMMGVPLIGPQRRIYADILRQLKARPAHAVQAWDELDAEIHDAAASVTKILVEILRWPRTAVFLPEDPADIPFCDRSDGLAAVEAIMAVERHFAVELPESLWSNLSKITFGEMISKLVELRKLKQVT